MTGGDWRSQRARRKPGATSRIASSTSDLVITPWRWRAWSRRSRVVIRARPMSALQRLQRARAGQVDDLADGAGAARSKQRHARVERYAAPARMHELARVAGHGRCSMNGCSRSCEYWAKLSSSQGSAALVVAHQAVPPLVRHLVGDHVGHGHAEHELRVLHPGEAGAAQQHHVELGRVVGPEPLAERPHGALGRAQALAHAAHAALVVHAHPHARARRRGGCAAGRRPARSRAPGRTRPRAAARRRPPARSSRPRWWRPAARRAAAAARSSAPRASRTSRRWAVAARGAGPGRPPRPAAGSRCRAASRRRRARSGRRRGRARTVKLSDSTPLAPGASGAPSRTSSAEQRTRSTPAVAGASISTSMRRGRQRSGPLAHSRSQTRSSGAGPRLTNSIRSLPRSTPVPRGLQLRSSSYASGSAPSITTGAAAAGAAAAPSRSRRTASAARTGPNATARRPAALVP